MIPARSSPDITETINRTSPSSPGGVYDPRTGLQYPAGYHKIGWSAQNSNRENVAPRGHGAYKSSEDRTNSQMEVRRSMPAPHIKPFLHDYQNINELKSGGVGDSDATADAELQKLTAGATTQPYDPRPMCSPPAPPVRDVSSMKFANHMQSHEKYPSWPVTQPSMETEGGEPINSPKFHPQLGTVKERNNSPSADKKGDDYKRNASDPGFKKTYPFSNFIKRPKPADKDAKIKQEEIMKQNAEKVEDFFNSQPGYPQPRVDQDGHRIGDEKYSVPSPPERDGQTPDTKTLSEKIASIVRPQHDASYGRHSSDSKRRHERGVSPQRFSKDGVLDRSHGSYSGSSNLGETTPLTKGQSLVDTGTSPLHSPNEKFTSSNSASQLFSMPKDRMSESVTHSRSYIVKQMVCYNTGTQTEFASQEIKGDNRQNMEEKVVLMRDNRDQSVPDKSVQARLSSSESESSDIRRNNSRGSDSRRPGSKSDRYSGNEQSFYESRQNFGDNDNTEMAPMLRKLTREYYHGKLHGSVNEKRLSSSSSQESSLRSPGSDHPVPFSHYSGMKEAESYNSVVIHPDGNSLPFGRDYAESRSSVSESRHDMGHVDQALNMSTEPRSAFKPGRHSLDPAMFSPKYPLVTTANKSIHDPRYSSEANLQSPLYDGHRDHTRSMMSLNAKHSKSSSVAEDCNIRTPKQSFESSPPSHPHSSSDTRSSSSTHYSSDNTSPFVGQTQGQGQFRGRKESNDSVFTESPTQPRAAGASDSLSPLPKRPTDFNVQSGRGIGRTSSMKKAFGIYDEVEKTISASSLHRRQESDVTPNSQAKLGIHSRSYSHSDYIPMDQYRRMQSENPHMALIREDSSETRWEEAVRKSRVSRKPSPSDRESNYANLDIHKQANVESAKIEGYQHVDSYNRSLGEVRVGTNLRRTSSEQIRPIKERILSERIKDLENENVSEKVSSVISENPDSYANRRQSPASSQLDLHAGSLKADQAAVNSQEVIRADNGVDPRRISPNEAINVDTNRDAKQFSQLSHTESEGKNSSLNSPNLDGDLKKVQRNAVQEYIERFQQKKLSDSGEEENSASKDTPLFSDTEKSTKDSAKLTPTESFRQKYGHRAERAESLRRTRSVNSRDASEYMEMKRPEKPHPQTEWSRIRSQTGGSRPHSIGSDSSLVDPYAVTPLSPLRDLQFDNHQRSQSDSTTTSQVQFCVFIFNFKMLLIFTADVFCEQEALSSQSISI